MKFLKKIMPRSLYGRFLLIIILPTIIAQMTAIYVFYDRHWSSMSRNMASSLVGEINMIVDNYAESDIQTRNNIIVSALNYMNLAITFDEDAKLPDDIQTPEEFLLFASKLAHRIKHPFIVHSQDVDKNLIISIKMPDGLLNITTSNKRLANPTTYIFILWMTGTAALLTLVAVLFLRGQMRSIISLTKAAEKFGKGHDMPSFKPSGAKEIRLAAIAFIEMRERIKRLLTRRTQMLAGVSHDLRTPLTRMKLQLAMMNQKDEATIEMNEDVIEMERMLEGYLDFVRGESKEPTQDIQLKTFIKDIVNKYRKEDGRIEHNIDDDIIIHIKPHSFKRCITNLINNSLKYATFTCITAYRFENEGHISIFIDDNGSGIDQSEHKKVFQPFYRIEQSRNLETGGIGLGLAIARDIVHRHGGEISLDTATLGGLRVIITLPI